MATTVFDRLWREALVRELPVLQEAARLAEGQPVADLPALFRLAQANLAAAQQFAEAIHVSPVPSLSKGEAERSQRVFSRLLKHSCSELDDVPA